jgi:hypothetical protein
MGHNGVKNEWSHDDLANSEPIGHRHAQALFFCRSRGCAAPVERTLGKAAEHVAAKEITNVRAYENTHDHFSRKVARARLLNSLRETPGRPGVAFLGEYRKGVE